MLKQPSTSFVFFFFFAFFFRWAGDQSKCYDSFKNKFICEDICRYTFGTSPYPRLLDTSKDHSGQLMSHHVPFCFTEEHFKIKIRDTRSSKSKSVRKEKRDLTPAIIQRWSDSKTIFLLPSLGATFKPNLVTMHSPLLEHRHAFTSYYCWGHFSLAISKSHATAIVAFWW